MTTLSVDTSELIPANLFGQCMQNEFTNLLNQLLPAMPEEADFKLNMLQLHLNLVPSVLYLFTSFLLTSQEQFLTTFHDSNHASTLPIPGVKLQWKRQAFIQDSDVQKMRSLSRSRIQSKKTVLPTSWFQVKQNMSSIEELQTDKTMSVCRGWRWDKTMVAIAILFPGQPFMFPVLGCSLTLTTWPCPFDLGTLQDNFMACLHLSSSPYPSFKTYLQVYKSLVLFWWHYSWRDTNDPKFVPIKYPLDICYLFQPCTLEHPLMPLLAHPFTSQTHACPKLMVTVRALSMLHKLVVFQMDYKHPCVLASAGKELFSSECLV